MEEKMLFDSNAKDLVSVMEDLSAVNRKLAVIYCNVNGNAKEIEDDFDYMEIQRSVNAAVSQVGQVLGSYLAGKFY